jgi:hypothetical protein
MDAGKNGVEMTGSDSFVQKVYPILACYVANYTEQCLVSCSKYGTCPKCQGPADKLQDPGPFTNGTDQWMLGVIDKAKEISQTKSQFYKCCMDKGISGSMLLSGQGSPTLTSILLSLLMFFISSTRAFSNISQTGVNVPSDLMNWTAIFVVSHLHMDCIILKTVYLHSPKYLAQRGKTWRRSS